MSTRKLTILIAVCLLAVSFGGLAAGALAERVDASSTVGVPRHGDRVAYAATMTEEGEETTATFTFTWAGREDVTDAWGRALTVDALQSWWLEAGDEDALVEWHGFPGGSLGAVVSRSDVGGSSWFSSTDLLGRQDVMAEGSFLVTRHHDAEASFLCLVRAGWQGHVVADVDGLPFLDACPHEAFVDAGAFRAAGATTVAGIRGYAFEVPVTVASAPGFAFDGGYRVVLAPGFAYPLAVSAWVGDSPGDVVVSIHFTLEGFEPGDGDVLLGAHDELPPGRRDAGEFAATTTDAGLPVDGRPDAILTLQDAYRAIEEDPRLDEWRAWRAANPAAGLHRVTWTQHEVACTSPGGVGVTSPYLPEGRADSWTFWWLGADGTYKITEARANDCATLPRLPGALATAQDLVTVTTYVSDGTGAPVPERVLPVAHAWRIDAALKAFNEVQVTDHAASALTVTFPAEYAQWGAWDGTVAVSTSASAAGREDADGEFAHFDLVTGALRSHAIQTDYSVTRETTPGELPVAYAATRETIRAASAVPPVQHAAAAVPDGIYWSVGTLSLILLTVAAVAPRVPVAGALLYTRLSKRDVLTHPRREAMLALARDRPGVTVSEMQRALDLATGPALYHVAVLVRERHLVRVDTGAATRLFPAGHAPVARLREEAVRLDAGAGARALALVEAEPGIHASEIARRLGVSRPAAHNAIARLEREGLVVKRREGRRVALFPANASVTVRPDVEA